MPKLLAALVLILAFASPALADENDDLLRDLQALKEPASSAPSEQDLQALVDQTLPRVAKVMGVAAPGHVTMKLVTRTAARQKLIDVLHRDHPGDQLPRLGEALSAVGLADPNVDLTHTAEDVYGANVSGFYDPHDHVLYLLADQPMEAQSLIVSHELAHAVQDSVISIDAVTSRVRSSEDAQLALSAALEGQAQAVAAQVSAQLLSDALGSESGAAEMLEAGTAGSAAMAAQTVPVPWLGMQLSFPYNAGAKLVASLRGGEDQVGRALLRRLPASTAQVLAPELYKSNERPREAQLNLAQRLPDASPVYATTLGRANLDLFGQLHGGGDLGEGWRGDRLEVVRSGGKLAAIWAVSFASAAQATRCAKAWAAAVHGAIGTPALQPDGSSYVIGHDGTTAVLTTNLPEAKQVELQAAALAAFK